MQFLLCATLSLVVYTTSEIVEDRSITVETTFSLVPAVRRSSCLRLEDKNIIYVYFGCSTIF